MGIAGEALREKGQAEAQSEEVDIMFGIDEGPSSGETGATNSLNNLSGFAGSEGRSLISNSSAFINDLLSGDPAKIAKLLAPQIGAITGGAQQKKSNLAQFTTRSGGTTSAASAIDDSTRGSINDLISSLTGSAVNAGSAMGTSLLGSAMSGYGEVFNQEKTMQQQRASKWSDLIGSIAGVAGGALAGIPAGAGSFADIGSNVFGAMS